MFSLAALMKLLSAVFHKPTQVFSIDGWKSHFWFTKRQSAEKSVAMKERMHEATSSQFLS